MVALSVCVSGCKIEPVRSAVNDATLDGDRAPVTHAHHWPATSFAAGRARVVGIRMQAVWSWRMTARSARGSLEAEVLTVLWSVDVASTPAEVQAAIGRPLAYTTVLTILQRLHTKGHLTREQRGRGHAYRPIQNRVEVAASLMQGALAEAGDREAALSCFVATLRPADVAALRSLIDAGAHEDR